MTEYVDANVTFEPTNASSDANVSNSILANFNMTHRDCNDEIAYNDSTAAEVCEDDFVECATVGMYSMKYENLLSPNTEFKNTSQRRGCDDSKMFVPTSDAGPKQYCCVYCKVRVQKLERHLRNVHPKETDVKKYLSFPLRKFLRKF